MTAVTIESLLFVEGMEFEGDPITITSGDVEVCFESQSDKHDGKAFAPTDHRLILTAQCGRVRATTLRPIGFSPDDFPIPPENRPAMLGIDSLPEEPRLRLLQTWTEIETLAARAIRLARWQLRLRMSRAEPIHVYRFVKPRPEESWGVYEYPCLNVEFLARAAQNHGSLLTALLAKGLDEPIARSLHEEAVVSLNAKNGRSAVALAVAAAEVAVKAFIADAVPRTEWLLQNLPSPPIDKMCRDYLPSLSLPGGQPPVLPKPLVRAVQTSIELRNKLMHRGATVTEAAASEVVTAVSDLLSALEKSAASPPGA